MLLSDVSYFQDEEVQLNVFLRDIRKKDTNRFRYYLSFFKLSTTLQ